MNIKQLRENLINEGYTFTFIGSEAAEIYAAEPFSPKSGALELEHTLYVVVPSDAGTITSFEKSVFSGAGIFISEVPEQAEELLFAAKKILMEENKQRDFFLRLQNGVRQKLDICTLIAYCFEIMGNPVFFVNRTMNVICRYPQETEKELTDYVAACVERWRNAREQTLLEKHPRIMIRKLCYRQETYYFCVIEKTHNFSERATADALAQICEIFQTTASEYARGSTEETQLILSGLLQKSFECPEREVERLKAFGWKPQEKYYVLAIEKNVDAEMLREELSAMLKTSVFDLGSHYAALLYSEKFREYTEQDFPKLSEWLKKNGLLAVLSFGFSDLKLCALRLEQCISTLQLDVIRHEKRSGLRYCGRYQISLLMSILNQDHQIDLRNFCSPIILDIYEADKKNHTEYLDTLFTYICSGQSMKTSADAMNIHVNTMYMRVNKLKDEFKIDFEDEHTLYCLHNSIVFLHLSDLSALKDGFPYIKK